MNDQPPPIPAAAPPRIRPCVMTGLSGNEIYCLRLKGFTPGDLVIGNSVHSLGIIGNIGAGLQGIFGGEVTQVTNIIGEGRHAAFNRLISEAQQRGAAGLTGVTNELRHLKGNIEFLSVASSLHRDEHVGEQLAFSSSSDGQELYCLLDCGYVPRKFVFGNVAYSIGLGGGILGGLKSLARGEIREYSDVFNATRHLALQRIVDDARAAGANAVLGIETRVMPFQGVHEMLMFGTAAYHPGLPPQYAAAPVTSDMTCEEMWNMANIGYAPLKLVLRTAIYSLGVVGGLKAALQSIARGEIGDLTSLIYDAREHAIGLLKQEADAVGADDVIGIHVHIHELGSLIEFMAVGTAVKRLPGISTLTPALPPQAVIRDKSTWITGDDILREQLTA